MPQDWDIKSRSAVCQKCEAEFKDKETYFSCLAFGDDGYQRHDFCSGCWSGDDVETSTFSAWHGIFRVPPPKPEEPLKKENAETLLRRLIEEDDEQHQNVVFILAVMLERKRILSEKEVRFEENSSIRVYEHRKSGETFIVRDPHLRLDRLEAVQEQVINMLEGAEGKPSDESTVAPPDETNADAPAGDPKGLDKTSPTYVNSEPVVLVCKRVDDGQLPP